MKEFPILGTKSTIPWSAIARHDEQAKKNHYQTLERLAERGGLSWDEALAVLEDRPWKSMRKSEAQSRVLELVKRNQD